MAQKIIGLGNLTFETICIVFNYFLSHFSPSVCTRLIEERHECNRLSDPRFALPLVNIDTPSFLHLQPPLLINLPDFSCKTTKGWKNMDAMKTRRAQ